MYRIPYYSHPNPCLPSYYRFNTSDGSPDYVSSNGLSYTRRPNPLLRVFRRDQIIVPAVTNNTPVVVPAPTSSAARKGLDASATPKKNKDKRDMNPPIPVNKPSQAPRTYLSPQFGMLPPFHPPPFPPVGGNNDRSNQDAQKNQGTMVRSVERQSQQQFDAPQLSSTWGTIPGPHPMFTLPNPAVNFHTPPPPSFHGLIAGPAILPPQGLINHPHGSVLPQRIPTEAMKYKCHICGKQRSAGYHLDHPLLPGQLPGKTTCRRCRKNVPDSEDDSVNSYAAAGDTRRTSRARHDSRLQSQKTDRSGAYFSGESSPARDKEQYSPGSSSPERRFDEHASYLRRSPSPDPRMTRRVHVRSQPDPSRQVRTVGDDEDRRDYHRHGNEWYEGRRFDGSHAGRHVYHSASPVSYPIHRQRSDPMTRVGDERGLAEHSHGTGHHVEDPSYRSSCPVLNEPLRRPRIVTVVEHVNHPDEFDPDPYHLYDETVGIRDTERIRSTSGRSRGRNGNRQNCYDGGASEEITSGHPGTPAIRFSGSPAVVQQVRHTNLPTVTRSSSRSRYTVQLSHHHDEGPREATRNIDDYDWYDDQGMRVRVREI